MQAGWISPARIHILSVSRNLCQGAAGWLEAPWPHILLWFTAPKHSIFPRRSSEARVSSFPWEALLGPEHTISGNKCKWRESGASHVTSGSFHTALRGKPSSPLIQGCTAWSRTFCQHIPEELTCVIPKHQMPRFWGPTPAVVERRYILLKFHRPIPSYTMNKHSVLLFSTVLVRCICLIFNFSSDLLLLLW